MIIERAWVLLFLALPLVWAVFEWRRTNRRILLLLKTLALVAVVLALSEPVISISEDKMAVAILVDTSASVSAEDLARASALAGQIERARGRNLVRVVPFARATRMIDPTEQKDGWHLRHTAGEGGRATDLEAGIREAVASLPEGMAPRVVLISDGQETRGSIARAAHQARLLGVPVDAFPLRGRPRPNLTVSSVTMPAVVFSGERFPIDLVISAPKPTSGTVELTAEGRTLGAQQVNLAAGENRIRMQANVNISGALEIAGALRTASLGEARFVRALMLRRPRAIYVSQDPPGSNKDLLEILASAQFEIVEAANVLSVDLKECQLLILNNHDLDGIPPARKADIEDYVKHGGGLLVIGGEKNVYAQEKTVEDALDRALPAKLAPPRSPEGTLVVLIVDKSSSMEGRKMELARLAAIGVIENLRPIDNVGVLIFDNSFQWAVPIRKAEDRSLIKRLVAGITPDGGTQIAPALAEAYKRAIPQKATFKHIVLLTDGISEEGDSMTLAKDAATQRVTISTVGLGQDVNRAYLEKIAANSKGKSYFLTDPSGLEQILLRDVMEHTGTTAVEKPVQPVVVKQTEILEGVGMESAPPLKGYVKFIAKPTADTILTVERDPLLARWQYGLGRAIVFASDAKSRWADRWVTWNGFDRFWANCFRDLLPHTQAGEASISFDSASGELSVDYRLGRDVEEPAALPDIFVFGPDDFQRPVELRKAAAGAYRGVAPIGDRQGLFRVRPLAESRIFPEVGYYREESEMVTYGPDEFLLRQVAEFTGGKFNPSPGEIFDPGNRSMASTLRFWPGLLAIAIALNLAELVLRKWRGVVDGLRRG